MFLQNFNNNNNNYGFCESLPPPYHNSIIANANGSFGNFLSPQQQQIEIGNNFDQNQLSSPQSFPSQLISSQQQLPLISGLSSTLLTSFQPNFVSANSEIIKNCNENHNENINNQDELINTSEADNENDIRRNSTTVVADDGSVDSAWTPSDGSEDDGSYGISYGHIKFRYDQAECLCKALENSNNIHKLADFLSDVPASSSTSAMGAQDFQTARNETSGENFSAQYSGRQQILRAKALVLFSERKFDEFYEIITSNHFESEHHSLLQKLWNEAHYAEAEMLRGKTLDPVSRYRVRKKNAYPSTIWDGEGTSYCFKKSARAVLREAYQRHNTPNQHQKQELARLTKLSVVQVSNWFKNQRQRARQYEREGRAPLSTGYSGYSSGDCEGSDNENDNADENDNDEDENENDNANFAQLSPIPGSKRRKIANKVPNESNNDSVNDANSNDNASANANDNSKNNSGENFSHEMSNANKIDALNFAPRGDFYARAASDAHIYDAVGGNFSPTTAAMQICAMAQICNGGAQFPQQICSGQFCPPCPTISGLPYSPIGCYDSGELKNEPYFQQFRLFAPIPNCRIPSSSQPMGGGVQIGTIDNANQLAVPKYETL